MNKDAAILDLRDAKLSCRDISERLGISEGRVYSCLRRHGRTHEFRAQDRRHQEKYRPVLMAIYEPELGKLIHKHGSMTIEEAAGGGFIASFGDVPGEAKDTIWEAIRDAGEACDVEMDIQAVAK